MLQVSEEGNGVRSFLLLTLGLELAGCCMHWATCNSTVDLWLKARIVIKEHSNNTSRRSDKNITELLTFAIKWHNIAFEGVTIRMLGKSGHFFYHEGH